MGAVWTSPNPNTGTGNNQGNTDRLHTGSFLIQNGKVVAESKPSTVTVPGNGKAPAAQTPAQNKPNQKPTAPKPAAPVKQEEANLPGSRKGE
jgi:hypothetical protein